MQVALRALVISLVICLAALPAFAQGEGGAELAPSAGPAAEAETPAPSEVETPLPSAEEKDAARAEPSAPEVRAAIDAGNYFFIKHFEARDAQAIAELYTEDGRVIAPGAEPASGRAAIAEFWARAIETTKSVQLETQAVESDGALAVEEGVVRLTANDGSLGSERYLVVWKRVGRRWHLHRDIWNAGPAGSEPAADTGSESSAGPPGGSPPPPGEDDAEGATPAPPAPETGT